MNLHLFLAYCFAVAILVLMPGPIVTLVVANSLSHGSRSGLATVAGASIGNAILLGATAVGPSIQTLREHPELVDRAAAQGRATYCWTVDDYEDVEYCRDLEVGWVATNHPGRTKGWFQQGLSELPRR